MTKQPNERQIAADIAIQRALIRNRPDLSDGALQYLADAAKGTIEYRSHIAGEALDVTGLVEAVKQSEIGQLVYADDSEDDVGPIDHEAAVQDMNSQQRMNYARAHNLR